LTVTLDGGQIIALAIFIAALMSFRD